MILRVSFLAKKYVLFSVETKVAGAIVDPTALTVQMAFTVGGADPVAGDWKAASWETDATTNPDTYSIRCLVGGTGSGADAALAKGRYTPWVKITDIPEVPVDRLDDFVEVY